MKFIIIFASILLSACSSTTVHLYGRYLSEAQIEKVKDGLEKTGVKVKTNTLSFPESINQSTLLYSPFIQQENGLENITNSLSKLNWTIADVQMLVANNHWYKKDSVGLFLLPEGMTQNDRIVSRDLVNEYTSRNCKMGVSVQLNQDNTYEMFFSEIPDLRTEYFRNRIDYLKGSWKVRSYPYIELTSFNDRWWFYFEIQRKTETDKVSDIDIIELAPLDEYKLFPNCSFTYGVRK